MNRQSDSNALTWTLLDGGWWRAARGRHAWFVVQADSCEWTATRVVVGSLDEEKAEYLGARDTAAKALALCNQNAAQLAGPAVAA